MLPEQQENESGEDQGPSEELVKEARDMGWRPLEEFKGNKDKWVSAEEYVEKGKHVLPILQADRDRLRRELLTTTQKIGTLQSQIEELRSAQERLDAQSTEANKRDVAAAKATLVSRLKQAREDNDVDAEVQIQEQLSLLNREPEKKPAIPDKKQTTTTQLDPEFEAWMVDNPWFNEPGKKPDEVVAIGQYLRSIKSPLTGRAFMDECVRIYNTANPEKREEKKPSKYENGSNQGSGRGSNGGTRSFSSLPADAKAACAEFENDVVGEGKKFKTREDYQKYYASEYYRGQE